MQINRQMPPSSEWQGCETNGRLKETSRPACFVVIVSGFPEPRWRAATDRPVIPANSFRETMNNFVTLHFVLTIDLRMPARLRGLCCRN
jgi:hypothetical protein